MRKFYLLLILGMLSATGWAQYDRSAGVRLGRSGGLTYKKFIYEEEALEFLLSGRNKGLQLTGTYQSHRPLKFNFSDRFYLHYGVGGHFGFEKRREYRSINRISINNLPDPFDFTTNVDNRNQSQFTTGIDGVVGVEYRWIRVPITIGTDMRPYFDFIGMRTARFEFWDSALSVRYVF